MSEKFVSTGQVALGRLGNTVLLSARCRQRSLPTSDGGSRRRVTASVLGGQRWKLDGGSRRRDDDSTVVSSSFEFSSFQFLPASAGKLDGGSGRRDEVVSSSFQFSSLQFTSVLPHWKEQQGAPTETDGCLQATADDERRRTARRAR